MLDNQVLQYDVRYQSDILTKYTVVWPFILMCPFVLFKIFPKKTSKFLKELFRFACLYVSYAIMIPFLKFPFMLLYTFQLQFLLIVLTICYLIAFNYDFFLDGTLRKENPFNINTSFIFTQLICIIYFTKMNPTLSLLFVFQFNLYHN
jgi:hypothetical protein